MEKRALLAIVLSVVVMAAWQYFFAPKPVPPPSAQAAATTDPSRPTADTAPASPLAAATTLPAAGSAPAEGVAAGPAVAAEPVAAAEKQEFRLTSATQDIRFSNEGGRASRWRLSQYRTHAGDPVDLIPDGAAGAGTLPLQVEIRGEPDLTERIAGALHLHEIQPVGADDPSGLGPGQRLTFTWADGAGVSVRKSLLLPDEGYRLQATLDVTRNGRPLPAALVFASGLTERADTMTSSYGHVDGDFVRYDGKEVERIPSKDLTQRKDYSRAAGTPVLWAGLETTYFAALVIPPAVPASPGDPGANVETAVSALPLLKPASDAKGAPPLIAAALAAEGPGAWDLFVGPKDYATLTKLGSQLDRVIDFSRFSLIYVVTKALFIGLTIIKSYVGNYGWAIIILTILVRIAFFPLTYKSAITMRQTSKKMAKIQPRVKAIQDRYRKIKKTMESQRKQNEEVMALYKKEGINPMSNLGGCLPLLLQMPVFIAFYNLLAVTIELRQAPFIGWIHDLSHRDTYYITPILMGASWLVQQAMTSSSIPDPMQRRMMYLMPVMFTFFMMNMPSGLVLYWFMNNVLGIAQQYITNRKADQLEAEARGQSALVESRGAHDGQTA